MGLILVLGDAIDGSPPSLEMQLGHVWILLCMFQTVILRWFSTDFYLENESFNFPYIRILFMYWSRGLFLRMVQPKSRFRNLKRDGTTQEFVSCTFRIYNSKTAYWPNALSRQIIAADKKNFVQTVVEEKMRNRSFAVS